MQPQTLQGYLAQKKQLPPLGPSQGHRHSPTLGSKGGVVSYERGTPCNPSTPTQVPPSYVNSEAKLTVVGGCILELVTVRNHACALITETEPFYFLDPNSDLLVNEVRI